MMTVEDIRRVRSLPQDKLMEEWKKLSEVAGAAAVYHGRLQQAFADPTFLWDHTHPIDDFLLEEALKECEKAHVPLGPYNRENRRRKQLSAHERIAIMSGAASRPATSDPSPQN